MRWMVPGCVLVSVSLATAPAAAAKQAKPGRTVQVIVMQPPTLPLTAGQDRTSARRESDAATYDPDMATASLPESFRTHDLSRRWVAFEMANSFAAPATSSMTSLDAVDPFAHVGTAQIGQKPVSKAVLPPPAIAIPRWMQTGVAFSSAPTSFAPGCAPSGYRASGFLDARTEDRRLGYYGMMSNIACEYGIPVGLFDAMIIRESGYKPGVFSAKSAFGLTQLMPETAAGLGVDRYDVEQNLRGGARYLRQQLDRFGQVHLALAAYNAGPGRIRGGMLPRIAETQAYVGNVLLNWQRLAGLAQRPVPIGPTQIAPVRPARLVRTATVSSY